MGNSIGIKLFKKLRKLNKDMELIVIIIFKGGIRPICWWRNGNIGMRLILVNRIPISIMLPYLKIIIVKLIAKVITSYKLTMTKII
jgi:hypothetical protein